ncbi:MAG: hypothetical protein KIT45_05405 [Fimbriimonadia bacterium]|nr:hypothetical protein [Fimbriimonadia bacterium]
MSITLELDPALESHLKAQAEQQGLSLSEYIAQMLVAQSPRVIIDDLYEQSLSSKEWEATFLQWVNSFKHAPKLPPSAFKRDSFYVEESK